jgi:hypothetical protein
MVWGVGTRVNQYTGPRITVEVTDHGLAVLQIYRTGKNAISLGDADRETRVSGLDDVRNTGVVEVHGVDVERPAPKISNGLPARAVKNPNKLLERLPRCTQGSGPARFQMDGRVYTPSARGKRASSSGVELFGTEHPGAAIYLAPACALASVHCIRISPTVNFS